MSHTTHFHSETDPEVRYLLDSALNSRQRVRVFYGDVVTGQTWDEENDVVGRIGRSTGMKKVPLMVANSLSRGGGALLDHCIVGIRASSGWLYQHPSFNTGKWTHDDTGAIYKDGAPWGRNRNAASAERFCAFMEGRRMGK